MGHRANYVLIKHNQVQIFSSQFGAMTSSREFAKGPEEATELFSDQKADEKFLEPYFAEGGYLIDWDRKKAILFGTPDAFGEKWAGSFSYFKENAKAWSGWTLHWDERGVEAFSQYLRDPQSYQLQTGHESSWVEIGTYGKILNGKELKKANPDENFESQPDISESDGDWIRVMDVLPDEGFVPMDALVKKLSAQKKNKWSPERAQKAINGLIVEQELLASSDKTLVGLNNELNRIRMTQKR